MADMVVDLPEPAVPVTSTRPRLRSASLAISFVGRSRSARSGAVSATRRKTAAGSPSWRNAFRR